MFFPGELYTQANPKTDLIAEQSFQVIYHTRKSIVFSQIAMYNLQREPEIKLDGRFISRLNQINYIVSKHCGW